MLDIEPFLRVIGQPAGVSQAAADYTRGILWGILPYFLFVVLRQTLQAMSVVRQAAPSPNARRSALPSEKVVTSNP